MLSCRGLRVLSLLKGCLLVKGKSRFHVKGMLQDQVYACLKIHVCGCFNVSILKDYGYACTLCLGLCVSFMFKVLHHA